MTTMVSEKETQDGERRKTYPSRSKERREDLRCGLARRKKPRLTVAAPPEGREAMEIEEEDGVGRRPPVRTPRLSPKSKSHAQPARGSSTTLHIYRGKS
jgi:hypothetical protein